MLTSTVVEEKRCSKCHNLYVGTVMPQKVYMVNVQKINRSKYARPR